MLAELDEVALGRCECVLEDRDQEVRARPVGTCLRGAATELLLVEPDHLVRDLHLHGELLVRARLLPLLVVGRHSNPLVLRMERTRGDTTHGASERAKPRPVGAAPNT